MSVTTILQFIQPSYKQVPSNVVNDKKKKKKKANKKTKKKKEKGKEKS